LTVGVLVDGERVRVQLARADVFPSMDEWRAIMSHWPGQCVVEVEPRAIKDTSTYYLLGRVRMTPELMDVRVH
jgi:hypothetical protein